MTKCVHHEREIEQLSDATTSPNAKIHAVLTKLSPIKNKDSSVFGYFDGEVSDGNKKMRIYFFESAS